LGGRNFLALSLRASVGTGERMSECDLPSL
jgi:hypothetical protein